jgi:hypothetical protein
MNIENHSPTRSEVICEIRHRAIRGAGSNVLKFASDVVAAYLHAVAPTERIVEFHPEQGSVAAILRAQNANRQLVNRFLSGVVKFPADLEEAWVAALPQPFRDECVSALAARYGLLTARAPNDVRSVQSDFAMMMHKYADVVDDLGKVLADGKINNQDRHNIAKAERDIDALIGELVTLRTAARRAIGKKNR